jgi:hypothetical protein
MDDPRVGYSRNPFAVRCVECGALSHGGYRVQGYIRVQETVTDPTPACSQVSSMQNMFRCPPMLGAKEG